MSFVLCDARPFGDGTWVCVEHPFHGFRDQTWADVPFQKFMEGVVEYNRGAYVQDAFSFLDSSRRKFLMTGTTKEEWVEMWSEKDEI